MTQPPQTRTARRTKTSPDQAPTRVVVNLDPPSAAHATTAQAPHTSGANATDRRRTRVEPQWTARRATPTDAELLNVARGALILHIQRTVIDADGRTIKVTTTLCPADRTVLHHSYPIAPHD